MRSSEPCAVCGGAGWMAYPHPDNDGGFDATDYEPCPACVAEGMSCRWNSAPTGRYGPTGGRWLTGFRPWRERGASCNAASRLAIMNGCC